MNGEGQSDALAVARERFFEGLPRKAAELVTAVEQWAAQPMLERPREDLRRRLHALYASAQVFRAEALAAELKRALDVVDAVKHAHRRATDSEFAVLRELGRTLPDLGRPARPAGFVPTVGGTTVAEGSAARAAVQKSIGAIALKKPTTLPVAEERLGATKSGLPTSASPSTTPRHATLRGIPSVQPTGEGPAQARLAEAGVDRQREPDAVVDEDPSGVIRRRPTDPIEASAVSAGAEVPVGPALTTEPRRDPSPADSLGPTSLSRDLRSSDPVPYGLSEFSRPAPRDAAEPADRAAGGSDAPEAPAERWRHLTTPAPPGPELARQSLRSDLPPPRVEERAVCSLLLIDDRGELASVPIVLSTREFEITSASTEAAALKLARTAAPDVILAEASFLRERAPAFVKHLRSDPRVGFVPIVCVMGSGEQLGAAEVEALGADAGIERPIDADTLQRLLVRVTGLETEPGLPLPVFGDVTMGEVADKVAGEIRRGLVESAEFGQGLRVDLGDGSTVMAAAWDAVARIRADLRKRSGGRVQFRDAMGRGGPRFVPLDETGAAHDQRFDFVSLVGRTVIVADDQTEVRALFTAALEEVGARVLTAQDGAEALALAEAHRPDVIVSDILMPNLDGFGLCRAIEQHPELGDVPVVLLSWKEDLLQRMQDMGAGASGYLTKDVGAVTIVRAVKAAIWPRERLAAELKQGSEVRGRVEDVGLRVLLKFVARRRSRAKVDIRDPRTTFALEFRGGRLLSAVATPLGAEPIHGEDAAALLMGVRSARFTVSARDEREGRLSDAVRSAVTADDPVVARFIRTVELVEEPTDTEYDGPEPMRTLKPGVLGPSQSGVMRAGALDLPSPPRAAQPSFLDSLWWLVIAVPLLFALSFAAITFVQGVSQSRIDPSTGVPFGAARSLSARSAKKPRASAASAVSSSQSGASDEGADAPPSPPAVVDSITGVLTPSLPVGVRAGERDGAVEIRVADGLPAWDALTIDDAAAGALPQIAVLPEGRHTFVFSRGDELRFRVWYVPRGHTRVVAAP